jgi:hypothetical protein
MSPADQKSAARQSSGIDQALKTRFRSGESARRLAGSGAGMAKRKRKKKDGSKHGSWNREKQPLKTAVCAPG